MESLKGKKTYLVAGLMIAYGVLGFVLGYQDAAEAGKLVLEGFGLIMLRLGVAKAEEAAKG